MPEMWNVYESFQALLEAGPYHLILEGILLGWVIWLLVAAKSRPRPVKLTKKEEEQLLAEWEPEPLLSTKTDPDHPALHPRTVHGKLGHYVDLGNGPLLNMASNDFLRFSERDSIEKAAIQCLNQYGVGSCGPRGFFGTAEVHLDLEKEISTFFGTESTALYSYGFSTLSSAIPAYAKSGDVIFTDQAVWFPIQRGLQASRSRIVYFKHNDVDDLRKHLEQQAVLDQKDPKKANATRRFLVLEGLYYNTGELCRLPELLQLRKQYKLRLLIDESCAFGTIGRSGRGAVDHFNIPNEEVDLIMCSLEMSAASNGGFVTGTRYVVEHQRLSGLGYVFSASLPPMLAAAAQQVLALLTVEAETLIPRLQDRCRKIHELLQSRLSDKVAIVGSEISPVKHLNLSALDYSLTQTEQEKVLRAVVLRAEERGVALVVAALNRAKEAFPPPPSIRLAVNVMLTEEELETAVSVVCSAFDDVLKEVFQ